ncbi:MAG: SDR family NAD-dependent epimerase/dehydratase, partial [Proteobacteria bacterium]|nr:SDR family NAD-dependent epimerase/dehydratase [Pseudomonadota bacterium]
LALMGSAYDMTGPVNLGNPAEVTILELAELVTSLTGSKSVLKFAPRPADDPQQRRPDISLARSTLNWQPRTRLEDGLPKSIDYFQGLLSQGRI